MPHEQSNCQNQSLGPHHGTSEAGIVMQTMWVCEGTCAAIRMLSGTDRGVGSWSRELQGCLGLGKACTSLARVPRALATSCSACIHAALHSNAEQPSVQAVVCPLHATHWYGTLLNQQRQMETGQAITHCTMKFKGTTKVLDKRMQKYYKISWCTILEARQYGSMQSFGRASL